MVDDGVGEGERLGPSFNEKSRKMKQKSLKVLTADFKVVNL